MTRPPGRAARARAAVAVLAIAAFVISAVAAAAQTGGGPSLRGTGAIVGATLVDGTGAPPRSDAVVTFRDGVIDCVGSAETCPVDDRPTLDARGAWVTPGLIDAHVHFSQTGWADGRPDQAADLRERYPYEAAMARNRRDPDRYLRAYLCAGVTAVWDVGGYPWTWDLARRSEERTDAPHVVAVGPLVSARDHWLNLPAERQFLFMRDSAAVREGVRYLVRSGTPYVKVWYLVGEDSPDAAHYQAMLRLTTSVAREAGVPVIVHATGLWQAKDALRAGARHLVHSVYDREVDEEFLRLARAAGASYNPTLTVFDGVRQFGERRFDEDRLDTRCIDPGTLEKARSTPAVPQTRSTEELARRARLGEERSTIMARNLRRVRDAGIPVVTGTDAGNTLTLHGPAIFAEMEAMQAAGLSPMDVIVASTSAAARAMGRADLGVVRVGAAADLLVIDADPTRDASAFRTRRYVVRAGWGHRVEDLRFR